MTPSSSYGTGLLKALLRVWTDESSRSDGGTGRFVSTDITEKLIKKPASDQSATLEPITYPLTIGHTRLPCTVVHASNRIE